MSVCVHIAASTVLPALRLHAENSVQCLLTDPPYNTGLQTNRVPRYTKPSLQKGWANFHADWDVLVDHYAFSQAWLCEAQRIMHPTGNLIVFGTLTHNLADIKHIAHEIGLWHVQTLHWMRTNPFPDLSGQRFTPATETALWFRKSRTQRSYFDKTVAERHPWMLYRFQCRSCHTSVYGAYTTQVTCRCGKVLRMMGDGKALTNLRDFFFYPAETWVGSRWKHPSRKPIALTTLFLDAFTPKGSHVTIVDPFAGSGTTGVAAQRVIGLTGDVYLSDAHQPYVHNLMVPRMYDQRYPLTKVL